MPDNFPSVPQPPMEHRHLGPGAQPVRAIIDNRTGLPDDQVREAVADRWVEVAGLQFSQPTSFQMYATNAGQSMLARTPFRTPSNVIDEMRLARSVADSDDDIGATIGQMLAIGFGEGLQNHHRDEKTLEFFNQMTAWDQLDIEGTAEEMYRELLISGQVTTLTLFTRNRLEYFPLKGEEAVKAQLQVPHVAILPAENIRVLTNDVMKQGVLAYHTTDPGMCRWLDNYFAPGTSGREKAVMAMKEPVAAALFTGRVEVPYTDPDPAIAGMTLYTLNPRMVSRCTLPKGSMAYARPLLTRNFALLEAKRLLNIMDYALLQGGTNYIVVAKKGTDNLPAQPEEVVNLSEQVVHAGRSGVLVGDHRLSIEIITPDLTELLNPAKRKLLGRKLAMGLLRQSEQNTPDPGTQGAVNEMELLARVVASDRRILLNFAQGTFYKETAERNRTTFKQGAPTIWGPKIILAGAKDFWSQVLNARDRGDIPRRWAVEALGFNYEAGLAERQREITRGDDDVLEPAGVPFSNPGEPQDNNSGRPPGTSTNNGRSRDVPGQGRDRAAPRRTITRNAGETVRAMVDGTEVSYIGDTTLALLEGAEGNDITFGNVIAAEREAIESGEPTRSGQSIILPVNLEWACDEFRTVKLDAGLRVVVGRRVTDQAMLVKALRFTEPHYALKDANDYAIRWGFLDGPMEDEDAAKRKRARCKNCGNELPAYSNELKGVVCSNCGTPAGMGGEGGTT